METKTWEVNQRVVRFDVKIKLDTEVRSANNLLRIFAENSMQKLRTKTSTV